MKFLVTGGAGFIGSHLVDYLIEKEHIVKVIDNFSTSKKENCNSNATYYNIDLSNENNLSLIKNAIKGVNGVFHLAAFPRVQESIDNPIVFEKNNTLSTVNILKACSEMKIKRLVYSSSSSVYGNSSKLPLKENDQVNPISPYAMQKYYGEVCCRVYSYIYNIETVSLRYFNVYGERQNLDSAYALVMSIFAKQRMNNLPLTIRGDGNQKRDFTHVSDIAKANLLAMQSKKIGSGEVINIGNGNNRSVNEIAKMMGGPTKRIDPVMEPRETLADNNKAKKLLKWKPSVIIEEWIPSYKESLGISD